MAIKALAINHFSGMLRFGGRDEFSDWRRGFVSPDSESVGIVSSKSINVSVNGKKSEFELVCLLRQNNIEMSNKMSNRKLKKVEADGNT